MKNQARMIKSSDGNKLAIVNPNAAGIDIADTEMQVCVPEDRDGDNNRRFGSFTKDLNTIVEWLIGCNITDRKSTRLNSGHANISYAVFCLKKKKKYNFDAISLTF